MELCHFSKSQLLADRILPECPLALNSTGAKKCQCRKRLYHVQPGDLRVLSCTYPVDWRGNPVNEAKPTNLEIDMSLIDAEAVPESKTATQAATKTAKQETKSAGGTVAALPPLFGEVNGSPLHIPIIGICGAKGSGKTLAAILLDPENTTLADIEDSSVTYNVPLAKRYSLYAEVKTKNPSGIPTPIECWLWFAGLIESGKITTRIMCVDPISDLQQGLVDWVRSNPEKFGRTETQYAKASGLLWADVKSHLKMTLGRLSRQVECFIFTSHMGTVWSGSSPVVGKMKAKGVDTFYELASLYLHLHRNVDPKTGKQPAAPVASIAPPIGKSRLARITFGKDVDSIEGEYQKQGNQNHADSSSTHEGFQSAEDQGIRGERSGLQQAGGPSACGVSRAD